MRSRALDYEAALALAQRSRRVIVPNSGFADQLRLWAAMDYSIAEYGSSAGWRTKQAYEDWRANRGILCSRDEEAKQEATRKRMADMAIALGGRRLKYGFSGPSIP